MHINAKRLSVVGALAILTGSAAAIAQNSYVVTGIPGEITRDPRAELWREPKDIAAEDLFYGEGGMDHQPHGPFTFDKEDLEGTNPKFDVRDSDGVKWKVKLGVEARPETVASRFVWAVGYHTDEDYFLPQIQVNGMPEHLHRGQDMVEPGGVVRNVRLKSEKGWKKVGTWSWRNNPFKDTPEFNGLRVMMAVISNWDLKDENNAIRDRYFKTGGGEREYLVSDLGASFGSTGRGLTHEGSKGNLPAYTDSKLISHVGQNHVDFNVPTRPAFLLVFDEPEFITRLNLRWIGKEIPIEDARRVARILAQLSHNQIRDAFRAGGYQGAELDGFTADFEQRIAELKNL
jgi:hypothetical protein